MTEELEHYLVKLPTGWYGRWTTADSAGPVPKAFAYVFTRTEATQIAADYEGAEIVEVGT